MSRIVTAIKPTVHPAAGTYYPAAPGARTVAESQPLYIGGERVSAVVDNDGTYYVLIGGRIVAQDRLNGLEGPLMPFFAAEALVAGGDDEEAAGVLVEEEVQEADLATVIEALGGMYETREKGSLRRVRVSAGTVSDRIRNARDLGVEVSERSGEDGRYFIEIHQGGSSYGKYFRVA